MRRLFADRLVFATAADCDLDVGSVRPLARGRLGEGERRRAPTAHHDLPCYLADGVRASVCNVLLVLSPS